MTDVHDEFELDPTLEAEVRAELHASIVPPATPALVYDRIERIAEAELSRGRRRFAFDLQLLRGVPAAHAGLAAVILVAALVGGMFVWHGNSQPAAPTPRPSKSAWATSGPPATGNSVSGAFWSEDGEALFAIVGDRQLHISTDDGKTWSGPRQLPAPTDLGLQFTDALHGFTAWTSSGESAQTIVSYRTADGGKTWKESGVASVPVGAGMNLLVESHFVDGQHGVITTALTDASAIPGSTRGSHDCRVYRTDDGAVSWTGPATRPCSWMVTWADGTTGWVPDADKNALWVTEDMAQTWHKGALPGIPGDRDLTVRVFQNLGPGHLRLAGTVMPRSGEIAQASFEVFETADGGSTWIRTYASQPSQEAYLIQGISAISGDHWVGLRQEVSTAERLSIPIETLDAGRSWTEIDVRTVQYNGFTYGPGPDSGLTGGGVVAFRDAKRGLIQGGYMDCRDRTLSCGAYGTYFLTDDGGHSWREIRIPS